MNDLPITPQQITKSYNSSKTRFRLLTEISKINFSILELGQLKMGAIHLKRDNL
jgi:hypothetical protein